jgi:hypothetical protein
VERRSPATVLLNGEVSHRWPEFLPGATSVLYTAARDQDFTSAHIISQSLETNSRTELVEGTYFRYAPSGHVVFARDASLFALPFDHVRLRSLGEAHPIVSDARVNNGTGAALFAVADTTLIYRAVGVLSTERALLWVTTDGREESIPVEPRAFLQPRLSPDGTRVAISVGDRAEDRDVWIYDLVHRSPTLLTADTGEDETQVWSPDGKQIAFSTARPGQPRMVMTLPANGGSRPTELASAPHTIHVSDWSPDGRTLAWTQFNPTSRAEVRAVLPDGSGASRTLRLNKSAADRVARRWSV